MKTCLWVGMLFLYALAGCAGIKAPELTACGEGNPCGWISPQGRPVSDHGDLGTLKEGYSDTDVYYYSGSQDTPTAVIRLKKEYALDDDRWKPITDPDMFLTLVRNMKTKGSGDKLQGFTIKAYDAQPIGVWYAKKYAYGVRFNTSVDRNAYAKAPRIASPSTQASASIDVRKRPANMLSLAPSICVQCHVSG